VVEGSSPRYTGYKLNRGGMIVYKWIKELSDDELVWYLECTPNGRDFDGLVYRDVVSRDMLEVEADRRRVDGALCVTVV
jgi:hypothetical protein